MTPKYIFVSKSCICRIYISFPWRVWSQNTKTSMEPPKVTVSAHFDYTKSFWRFYILTREATIHNRCSFSIEILLSRKMDKVKELLEQRRKWFKLLVSLWAYRSATLDICWFKRKLNLLASTKKDGRQSWKRIRQGSKLNNADVYMCE